MDRSRPSQATAFNTLPIELNKLIAHYLTDHKDIANYSAVCIKTRDAVDGDKYSFWRAKFCEDFARPLSKDNGQLRGLYKQRWAWLRRFTNNKIGFVRGRSSYEVAILKVLRDLINESFAGGAQDAQSPCPNMIRLREFMLKSKILLGGRRPPPPKPGESASMSDLLAAVRLMGMHFLLDKPTLPKGYFAIDDAQKAVYAATNKAPLFLGPKKNRVNMDWMLHCMNFFRFYMTDTHSSLLYSSMFELEENQRPSPWKGPLKSGSHPLSSCWKGTYSYLEGNDLARFRKLMDSDKAVDMFTDLNVDEGKIQSMNFDFSTGDNKTWPPLFEDRLQSLRNMDIETARAQLSKPKNIRLDGWGCEDADEHFYTTGWLNPLPDQCGIPGWQRVTFMKHFEDDLNIVDRDNLWAYEGVVLPGGRIILGRWWFASNDNIDFDDDYGGPFILWAVEPEPTDEEER